MYNFTTGSQLNLDPYSIFKYCIPPHPRSWDHKNRRWFYHSAPNTTSAHTGHTGGLVVAAMIVLLWLYSFYRWVALSTLSRGKSPFLLFLQVGRSFYSFYTRLIESKLSALCTNCVQPLVSFNLKSVLFLKRVEELCGKILTNVVSSSIYNVSSSKLQSSFPTI